MLIHKKHFAKSKILHNFTKNGFNGTQVPIFNFFNF